MAATVTLEEVKSMGVNAPDFVINGWIETANSADACIDALVLSDDKVKALKATFIAWQLDVASTGNMTSQRSATGAAISYNAALGQKNRYEKAFKAMQGANCLMSKVESDYSVFLDVAAPTYD